MNKAKAGYNMLMILSAVDNEFQEEEKKVIQEFVKKMWLQEYNDIGLEQDSTLTTLTPDDWMPRFEECSDYFYAEATEKERNEFLQFAMDLVKADDVITEEENLFLKTLFDAWDPDHQ
jgi:hypothetical protein